MSSLLAGVGLTGSFWVMIILQTIGSVDMPGHGARKLPSPRSYVAILVAWAVLFLVAGSSRKFAKAAERTGWLLVLTSLVVGPFGKTLTNFFKTVSGAYAIPPAPTNVGG